MNELALFAGAGGGLLASRLLGWHTVCAVEIERYPREVLLQRQRDGMLERFPIWDDVKTFDGRPWRGKVDIISGGFPCQDISAAGKGAGITGSRSGLWKEYARIISEVTPRFVFAENSPLLRSRGLGTLLYDLNKMGYDARWCVLGAGHLGSVHQRARMWVVAYLRGERVQRQQQQKIQRQYGVPWSKDERRVTEHGTRSPIHTPGLHGMGYGVANRVDRVKAIGNGQVPVVAATAFRILSKGIQ